jgi:hypothetical protein
MTIGLTNQRSVKPDIIDFSDLTSEIKSLRLLSLL